MRRKGKISPSKAARLLDVHQNTVYDWCHKAMRGEPTRLHSVEQHPVTGYYHIDLAEVKRLKER